MGDRDVLLGRGREMTHMPEAAWWSALRKHLPGIRGRFAALPRLHQAVRRAAVQSMPGAAGGPVAASDLAQAVGAPLGAVRRALQDLQRMLFFVVLDGNGDVAWAFPGTSALTPHRIALDSGERFYGA
jgi:hypothetical protein